MKTGAINYSIKAQAGLRFDASFHLSEGLMVKRQIASSPYDMLTIKDVSSEIYYGNRAKRVYVSKRENGIPFLSSSDILQADLGNVELASKKYTPCIEQVTLKKGRTLISRSGTIGNCTFANAKHAQRRLGICIPLASNHGHSLLTQGIFGAVIRHIEPNFIASLPILKFPDEFLKKVDDLMQESARLREEADDALNEAVNLFESEIGSSKVNLGYNTKSIKSNSISARFCRLDSQFQIGKAQITKYPNKIKIGNVAVKIFVGNRGKRYYVNIGIPFLSSSDMMLVNPLRYCKYISKNTPSLSDMIVNNRDILISKSGTVGNTIIVGIMRKIQRMVCPEYRED